MGSDHLFRELHRFGKKLHKFQERKSQHEITTAVFGDQAASLLEGVCFGMVIVWLKDVLSEANTLWERSFPDDAARHHQWNGLPLLKGARVQADYNRDRDHIATLTREGLQYQSVKHPSTAMSDVSKVVAGTACSQDPAAAIRDAVNVGRLLPGTGLPLIVRRFRASKGTALDSHSVGFARSRQGKLYFFDPSCGEYRVDEVELFIRAWIGAYRVWDTAIEFCPSDYFVYVNI